MMWRGGKQVKARQRKYKELAKGKKESCKICCKATRLAERKDFPEKIQWEKL